MRTIAALMSVIMRVATNAACVRPQLKRSTKNETGTSSMDMEEVRAAMLIKPKKAKARPTQQPTGQPTQKQETKKPKAKKPKFVKPALPKPEDLDKDLDSYMAAAPDPTLVA